MNTRGKSLFSEVCDWEILSWLFYNVCEGGEKNGEEGKSKISVENFSLETWIKEIQSPQEVTEWACGISRGHGPGKSGLGHAAFTRLIRQDVLSRCLMASATMRFCENQWIPEFKFTKNKIEVTEWIIYRITKKTMCYNFKPGKQYIKMYLCFYFW